MPKLETFKINRCLVPPGFGHVVERQIHSFSDASQDGFGSVSYLRLVSDTGQVHCSFLLAKSRLAPIKTQTIPRLELSAAVLAAKMEQVIRRELDMEIHDSFFWTDSMIVLGYVNNVTQRYHTFVANRVATIQEVSSPSQWRYVCSAENPADDASRGLDAGCLLQNDRWCYGPSFLWQNMSEWPVSPSVCIPDNDPEVKVNIATCTLSETVSQPVYKLINRYSSWYKLKKAVAWMLRLKNILKLKAKKEDISHLQGNLLVPEIQTAEVEIVKLVQQECFPQ